MKPIDFFKICNEANIEYCHWKSNEHLNAGLEGRTDLDILVSENGHKHLCVLLSQYKWIKMQSKLELSGVEDWLGFDDESGTLFHMHLHTIIPLGSSRKKPYVFKISKNILKHRRLYKGVYVPHPSHELLLLTARILFKTNSRHILKYLFKGFSLFPDNIEKEIKWVSNELLSDNLPATTPCFDRVMTRQLNRVATNIQENNISVGFLCREMLILRFYAFRYISFKRLFSITKKQKKRLQKGVVIAFVGVDGSGKSTVSQDTERWLSWKLLTHQCYLGLPRKTKFEQILKKVLQSMWPRGLYQIYAAYYRLQTAQKARKEAEKGIVVMTDRYPLKELWNQNDINIDGPRLNGLMGKFEQILYRRIPLPDKVFFISVDTTELARRDTSLSDKERVRKASIFNARIKSVPNNCFIDGNLSLDFVELNVKRVIWESLCKL